jgi:hypothetical protein
MAVFVSEEDASLVVRYLEAKILGDLADLPSDEKQLPDR